MGMVPAAARDKLKSDPIRDLPAAAAADLQLLLSSSLGIFKQPTKHTFFA